MTTQTLSPTATASYPEETAAPAAAPRGRTAGAHTATLLTLRLLSALALVTSSYLHVKLALESGLGGEPFTLPQLFLAQAAAGAGAGGALRVRDRELLWLPAVTSAPTPRRLRTMCRAPPASAAAASRRRRSDGPLRASRM